MRTTSEEEAFAKEIMQEAKLAWGKGWSLLSNREREGEVGRVFMRRVLMQNDSRLHIKFFQEVVRELLTA